MPWKATQVSDERLQFIDAVLADPRGNFSVLCARFNISRDKGYKWLHRYREGGRAGLEDRKSVALHCPHRTPDEVLDRIVAMRKERPYEGPRKIRDRLLGMRVPFQVPAASTIGDIIARQGLLRPRRARLRVPPHPHPLGSCVEPNEVWCTDFKGHFALGDKTRCYPLTLTDGASRFLLKCEALDEPKEGPVRHQLELAFREFGLPERIRSDNGPPFASTALGGLSRLSVSWIQLGILPERIEPGQPQQNGRHERMHRTLAEATTRPPQPTQADQQRAFDRFRRDYNEDRPHEALGSKTPASHYEPSFRLMPERPRPPEYGEDFKVRFVKDNGHFSWKGHELRAGSPLVRQPVGLRQVDEDEWELFYGPLLIGHVLLRDGKACVESLR